MGTPHSKINNNKRDISTSEAHLPSTPISTPKSKILDWDPRSPSENVVRTPIEIKLNATKKQNTPVIGNIQSSGIDLKDIDPRSPSAEISRTPIIIGTNGLKPRNKKLELVKQQLTNFSPMKPHGTEINPIRKQGPILLGISPVVKKVDQEKRKSYIGLLETDLDFVETDLDKVGKTTQPLNCTFNKDDSPNDVITEVTEETNEEILKLQLVQITTTETSENNDNNFEETVEPVYAITSVDSEETVEIKNGEIKETFVETSSYELVKESDLNNVTPSEEQINKALIDKEAFVSPIKETLERICQIDKEIKDVIACANNSNPFEIIDDENLSNAFDKKVTNLIYEDHEIINIPKNIKQQNNGGDRTPLGERNINQTSKKSANKLRIHDKPMNKKDYVVSKIPVFKEKKGKSKITQQCENTPPRQMTDIKSRKTQWDADKTMII